MLVHPSKQNSRQGARRGQSSDDPTHSTGSVTRNTSSIGAGSPAGGEANNGVAGVHGGCDGSDGVQYVNFNGLDGRGGGVVALRPGGGVTAVEQGGKPAGGGG